MAKWLFKKKKQTNPKVQLQRVSPSHVLCNLWSVCMRSSYENNSLYFKEELLKDNFICNTLSWKIMGVNYRKSIYMHVWEVKTRLWEVDCKFFSGILQIVYPGECVAHVWTTCLSLCVDICLSAAPALSTVGFFREREDGGVIRVLVRKMNS